MSVYRVTGSRPYRKHQPGRKFEAVLDPQMEQRAIARGAIEVFDDRPPGIRPGSYRLPDGWEIANNAEAAQAAFSLRGASRNG